ncbi:hypothetical protein SUDANB146_06192 [Streptomyces sp. enrichment culture]
MGLTHAQEDTDGCESPGQGVRRGPGMGAAVVAGAAGLAVGVVGGMVAAEVVDGAGDFFEGDEGGRGLTAARLGAAGSEMTDR